MTAVTISVAAVVMLVLAGSSSAATTYTVSTPLQLNLALAGAVAGDTIVIKPGVYYTTDATNPANGYMNANGGVTITGNTNKSGDCSAQSTTILDGDFKPGVGPGHNGPVFTIGGADTKIKCLTLRFGTAGVKDDGFSGLTVTKSALIGNGRNLDHTTDPWDGDGVWTNEANNVTINKSSFSGNGRSAVESLTATNVTGWSVTSNAMKNIHGACLELPGNVNTSVGSVVSGKKGLTATNGNTCDQVGVTLDAIIVGSSTSNTGNVVAGTRVGNVSAQDCFDIQGDGVQVISNSCAGAHAGAGASVNGASALIQDLSIGQTNGDCLVADGTAQTIKKISCDASRARGVAVNGNGSTVTGVEINQAYNNCMEANGDNQVWMNLVCDHVTNGSGLYSQSFNGQFTNVAVGGAQGNCVYLDDSNQTVTTSTCAAAAGSAYFMNADNLTLNGFNVTGTDGACVDGITGFANLIVKNGDCKVVSNNGVQSDQSPTLVDNVTIEGGGTTCFYLLGNNSTLSNSTGMNCGIGGGGQGIYWGGAGTATITKNVIRRSYNESIVVNTVAGGDFTITNNDVRKAQWNSCIFVATPDTLFMSGNVARRCYNWAYYASVNTNPKVNGNDGQSSSTNPLMEVYCNTTCGGSQVNGNTLDGTGTSNDGLVVHNTPGTAGFAVTGNTVKNMAGHGLVVDGGFVTLTNNTVKNASDTDDLFGIWLNSNSNTLTGSTVTGGYDNGIEVSGNTNTVNNNLVKNNGEDGIHVATGATGNSLTGNIAQNNSGEGLEDEGTGSTFTSNSSSGNRQDCAGTGGGTYTTNTCSDGSTFSTIGSINKPIRKHRN